MLSRGLPQRHHIVIYMLLLSSLSHLQLQVLCDCGDLLTCWRFDAPAEHVTVWYLVSPCRRLWARLLLRSVLVCGPTASWSEPSCPPWMEGRARFRWTTCRAASGIAAVSWAMSRWFKLNDIDDLWPPAVSPVCHRFPQKELWATPHCRCRCWSVGLRSAAQTWSGSAPGPSSPWSCGWRAWRPLTSDLAVLQPSGGAVLVLINDFVSEVTVTAAEASRQQGAALTQWTVDLHTGLRCSEEPRTWCSLTECTHGGFNYLVPVLMKLIHVL